MSDAQDIRAQRAQDQQDLELKKAQLTTQQFAAQNEQQRLRAGTQPMFKAGSQPEFNPTSGTYQQPAWDDKKQTYAMVDVPGVSPEAQQKQALESLKRNRAAAKEMMPPGTSDENLDYLAYTLSGMNPPPITKVTQMTGDAGKPFKGNDGLYYVKGKNADGTSVDIPMGPNYTPPAPKAPTSPTSQYANLLTKQILANRKQGPPLTNEEAAQLPALQQALDGPSIARMKAMAEYNAANRLFMATDPSTNMEIAVPISAGVAAFDQGTPFLAGAVSSPTGTEKSRQDFSNSGILQVNTMRNIIGRNSGMFGPGAGRLQNFVNWVGSNSPDAQRFRTAALILADHSAGLFGGRSVKTVDELKDTITAMKLTPEALLAGLDQDEMTFNALMNASGRLGPRTGGTGGAGGGQFVVIDPAGKPHRFDTQAQADNFRTLIRPK
jgi:hypothetical protein